MRFVNPEPVVTTNKDETLVMESILLEMLSAEEAESICEDRRFVSDLIKDEILTERSIVKLDKKAKLNRATMTSVYTIARKHKDPDFKKLVTLWRMEAKLEKKLKQKYGNEAIRVAKQSLRNRTTGNLPSVSKMGANSKAVKTAIVKAKNQLQTR